MVAGSGDERFRAELDRLVQEGNRNVVVDLTRVPYIDSSALGHLVHAYVSLRKKGGVPRLLNPSKRIVDLLSITRLIQIFEVYQSRKGIPRN